ncbi:hypothetical protein EIP86_008524 [Pleurotus ostreatoroseus]|nr:hypothetical protein EIP86_008524 [Pleurotus ostreatoroseus]
MKLSASTLVILLAPTLALAKATLDPRWANGDDCPTSPTQCCESSYTHDSAVGKTLLELSGKQEYNYGNVAVGCTPLLGNACSAEPNCCESNGLVSVACIPISL